MARPARRPGNVPAEATSFVGRERELAEVRGKLARARLVTLTGPGGVGKTRLAVRAATTLGRGFTDGAWWVELAEVREPALVSNAVLAALDLRDQVASEPRELLLAHLRDRKLLLVLDNCEHLGEAVALLVTDLLRTAPGVRVLATSREPLSVAGEHVAPVPPLPVPPADSTERQVSHNEAVMLFTERAAAGSGGFEVTAANQAAVVEICRRLDGLPLAIELAAVRTRVLTVEQIVGRLADRFGLLTGGGPGLPRHQTLRTAIDWSHDLLTPGEQTLLRRLCVFAGPFTLADVEAVTGDQALDPLSSLVDKSMVVKQEARGVACYRLHETMREYARRRLRESGEEDAVEARCAEHYRLACLEWTPQVRYRLAEWLGWMDLEIDNVRAVLRRCVARDDREHGLELTASLAWYWITRATSEGIRWFESLGTSGNPVALFLRGFLSVLQFDTAAARPVLDQAVTAARAAGLASFEAQALSMASVAANTAGDRTRALRLLQAAQAVATGPGDHPAAIAVLQARALGGLFTGDLEQVRQAASEGVRGSREVGDQYGLEMMLVNLACAALHAGELAETKPMCVEALSIARQIDDRVAQFCLLDILGCQAAGTGEPRRAARLLGAARSVRAGVGASVLPYLGPLVAEAAATARQTIGEQGFQTEFEAGTQLSRAAAIRFALGEPDRPDEQPAPVETPTLGKREAEVARLVADGLTNKQIGTRLLISEHTVDSHIRSILTKLGAGSRAQIAAWIARR
ncbi:LuxR C-terminal-related transcriptional regulator [Solwaraspora sp. WMMD1047]|uniref:ATP-binding protein n=1 Tax=Solwaraspora sp. WMMD1047 TaxID=3016102 RepID=UPI0024161FA3|nr:LuxR C-terminal-related transcriptional regulator [Solwaraspora sp. WMMD1047]MDG4830602.1 LuxR C-terminal-related transcriptional regulator [Solwaraspora sp. WMMD1047]